MDAEQVTALVGELRDLKEVVRRLEVTVRTKVAAPVVSLSTAEAAEVMGYSVTTIQRYQARGVFTDVRAGRKSGSPWRVLADEVDVLRLEGEDSLQRFREAMGRM